MIILQTVNGNQNPPALLPSAGVSFCNVARGLDKTNSRRGMRQPVVLPAGSYTFSAYVRVVDDFEVNEGAGCVFNGWIVMPCAEEDSIEPMRSYSLTSASDVADSTNTIVDGRYVGRSSAVLKADMRGTYTISFCDKYGAVIHTQQKNYGEDITLWSTTPTMSSYEFVCWIDEESGAMYMPGDQFFKNRNTTLISKWTYATDFIGIEIFNKPEDMTVYVGASHRLNAVANPMNLVVSCTWSSSNEAVATVDEKGIVTPLSLGTTTITVTATYNANGASETFEDSVNLTVVKHVFEFADGVSIDDADVREKALTKMNVYYKDKEIADVVDGRDTECNTCIFAFEGLGSGLHGGGTEAKPDYHKEHGFLCAMMVVTKGNKIKYVTRRASTLPDNRPGNTPGDGTTTLHDGIYDYKGDYHTADGANYAALIPTDPDNPEVTVQLPGWYLNSADNFFSGVCTGINIHATGQNPQAVGGEFSQGCQTVYSKDYIEFGKAVGFLKSDCQDTNPISKISASFTEHLNPSKEMLQEIKVKYILDRTFDEKNKQHQVDKYIFDNGVFYPIHHTCEGNCTFCK